MQRMTEIAFHSSANYRSVQKKVHEKESYVKIDKSQLKCEFCKGTKHTRETCFKLIGYPDWWKPRQRGGKQIFTSNSHANHSYIAEYENNQLGSENNVDQQEINKMFQEMYQRLTKGKEVT